MPVQLNHTIVYASDKKRSARFLADLLGLEVRPQFGPFLPVVTANDVALDFADAGANPIAPQHYAFLVTEEEFDLVFGRIEEAGLTYYADPMRTRPGEINRNDGGRGVYWLDPDGHVLEIITRHYGGA
ncbi:VOC family protein [Streptomyces qinglanensis]|uniref:Catechol 2,3-dioxygenase n=1 Tax=Streptomyces qinglanensis TaxID=943816 RepID=A0A1H9W152_9ACTN|nr:VOC family protein [Streptomyces qinglanensis]SES27632.1 Catechol 2,3-dioxygenase [Streptomyces qinglanensis]